MRRDLLTALYDSVVGIIGEGLNDGFSICLTRGDGSQRL